MPRLVSTDTRWLERHGQKWRVTVSVPRNLRSVLGTRLKRNLGTDSLAVANGLKLQVVAELQARIEHVRQAYAGEAKAVIKEAIEIAVIAKRSQGPTERTDIEYTIRSRAEDILGAEVGYRTVVDEDGDEDVLPVFDRRRQALAREFVEVASGRELPIAALHGDYLSKGHVKARTRADDARALHYLVSWCERERIPTTLQAITRDVVVRFVDDFAAFCGGLAERTQNKYLGRLNRYWTYLHKRNMVPMNPWAGTQVQVPPVKHDEEERAFTNDEVRRLLTGEAGPDLMDVMLIGALTGARLDAIVDLRVGDTLHGSFTFKPQKREPSARDVPVHPALATIIARRSAGKEPHDDFFPEWPAPQKEGSMRERSFKTSHAFTTYRRACGVDQVIKGKRRSLVNFHSFRRWFCTRMERTGCPEPLIAAIVGHKRAGMTLGRYSEGPEWKAAKRFIEKLRLPPLDGTPVEEERSLRPRNRTGRATETVGERVEALPAIFSKDGPIAVH